MAKARVLMEVGRDGIAVITISNPPVNALARPIIAGLKEKYAEAMNRNDVKAVVLTGDYGKFSGGFDINVFAEVHKTGDISVLPDVSVDLVVNTIEDAKKPSVAAIQGLALGGGLELTMGCHARISTPDAQLGLPELTLGVIPGFGGTQRLPRLVGISKAIDIMLLSKSIRAKEGKEYGLIDAIASAEELLMVARKWALDLAEKRKPRLSSLQRTDKLGPLSKTRQIVQETREKFKKTSPHMPQHQVCLDAIEEGLVFGGYAGVLKEASLFKKIVLSTTARSLVHVFFSQRLTFKVPKVTDIGAKPRHMKFVAIIGGGLMGSGIATALLLSDINVILKEINSTFLQRGLKTIDENLDGLVKKGTLTLDKKSKALSNLRGALDYSDFRNVDMVIEAVVEDVQLKQSIFCEIEKICPPHCILASNTSTIDLNVIGEKTNSHDRIVGAHFFSPAHIMPLLEVVRTEKTSPQVVLDIMNLGKIIQKVPVVVGNCPGFAVNRTFFPYSQAAQLLVHLGVNLFRVDRVVCNFGMPLGPFQLQDVAGYGVALAVKQIYSAAYKGRTFESNLLELMVEDGRNGKNNRKGYYLYKPGSKLEPDPTVQKIIDESRRRANLIPDGKPINVTDQEIVEMIFFPVVNEACRVLAEGVVVRASDIDIASVLGMGFPKYRGGLLFWADTIGSSYIYSKLKGWEDSYGGFFAPSQYLEERAKKGSPLSLVDLSESQNTRSRL